MKHKKVWDKTGGRCSYCGCDLVVPDSNYSMSLAEYTVDHMTPKNKGGDKGIDNLAPACRSCNITKNGKTVEEYRVFVQWKSVGVERFTNAQAEWLLAHGVEIPSPPEVTFFFEEVKP